MSDEMEIDSPAFARAQRAKNDRIEKRWIEIQALRKEHKSITKRIDILTKKLDVKDIENSYEEKKLGDFDTLSQVIRGRIVKRLKPKRVTRHLPLTEVEELSDGEMTDTAAEVDGLESSVEESVVAALPLNKRKRPMPGQWPGDDESDEERPLTKRVCREPPVKRAPPPPAFVREPRLGHPFSHPPLARAPELSPVMEITTALSPRIQPQKSRAPFTPSSKLWKQRAALHEHLRHTLRAKSRPRGAPSVLSMISGNEKDRRVDSLVHKAKLAIRNSPLRISPQSPSILQRLAAKKEQETKQAELEAKKLNEEKRARLKELAEQVLQQHNEGAVVAADYAELRQLVPERVRRYVFFSELERAERIERRERRDWNQAVELQKQLDREHRQCQLDEFFAKREADKKATQAAQQQAEEQYAIESSPLSSVADTPYIARLNKERHSSDSHIRSLQEDFIPELHTVWQKVLDDKLNTQRNARSDEVLATSVTGTGLTRQTLLRVLTESQSSAANSAWLDDEAVNAWFDALCQSKNEQAGIKKGQTPHFAAFNTAWRKTVNDKGVQGIARWSKRAKIQGKALLSCRRIFFPLNTGAHWTLLTINPQDKSVEYLDSLGGSGQKEFTFARQWLAMELGEAYKANDWSNSRHRSQRQSNSDDCGVFTCWNALASAQEVAYSEVTASKMNAARRRLAAILLNGGFKGDFAHDRQWRPGTANAWFDGPRTVDGPITVAPRTRSRANSKA